MDIGKELIQRTKSDINTSLSINSLNSGNMIGKNFTFTFSANDVSKNLNYDKKIAEEINKKLYPRSKINAF